MTWVVTGGAGYIGAHVVRSSGSPAGTSSSSTTCPAATGSSSPTECPSSRAVVDPSPSGGADRRRCRRPRVDRRRAPRRVQVRRRVGAAPAAHLRAERHRHAGAARPRCATSASTTSCSPRARRRSARPDVDLVTEQTPTNPESPYGESKLVGEWLSRDGARSRGLRHTSLRYFNVVGSGYDDLYDSSPHNLFPLVLKALDRGRDAAGLRHRLPDARRLLRARLHPRRRPRRRPRRGRRAARARASRWSRSTTSAAATASRCCEIMDAVRRGHRHRLRAVARAAPARRPGAHRRLGRARRARPRLADAARPRRHGRERVAGLAAGAGGAAGAAGLSRRRSVQGADQAGATAGARTTTTGGRRAPRPPRFRAGRDCPGRRRAPTATSPGPPPARAGRRRRGRRS